ncbi:zinc finger protein 263 [Fundulus heteroclitus]|uniref:zinc finger protein 263 n=1 Tax=Fundulus heteroclitus TaxID=8078 RepID=UPI00165A39E5|nr:zinc finger protein 263 [Fundulus heteroclitus]
MKPRQSGTQRGAFAHSLRGCEAVQSIQEELVAAIHGALEVAVELAVREVRTLVGQATSDMYEELRKENESLKEKLQRAEQLLDCVRLEGNDSGVGQEDGAPHPTPCAPNTNSTLDSAELRGEPAGHSGLGPDPRDKSVSGHEELRSDRVMAKNDPEKSHNKDVTGITSQMIALKAEAVITPCQSPQAPKSMSPLSTASKSTLEQVTIKQEELEEERSGASCCLNLIKEEHLSLEGIKWPPEVTDIRSQDPKAHLLSGREDRARPPNMSTSLPPPSHLQSTSPEFPNVFHLAEQASVSQAPPQVHGARPRRARNVSTIPMCKFCGQTFPVPSSLRRHYNQCLQRLQQCRQPSEAGGTRTRLQLYPPGCSPFHCTVCNREFNRLENLKTHLRIHTGEMPYTCSVCLKCFRHSGALTRHFRIHTGEKPYTCGQCGKSFRNCGGLRLHQRSHSEHLK